MDNSEAVVRQLAAKQGGVVTRQQALAAGMTTGALRWRLRSGEWQLACRGVIHVDVYALEPPEGTSVRAALLSYGSAAALGFTSAARLHGLVAPGASASDVDIVLPRRSGRRHRAVGPVRIRLHWSDLYDDEVTRVDGLAVTSVARTALDLASSASRVEAVSVLDSALELGTTRSELSAALQLRGGTRGCRGAAAALAEARSGAQSALETRVRLVCSDAGLPPDALQYPISDAGSRVLARADMAWVRPGGVLVAECDGAGPHGSPTALLRDRYRQNDLLLAGCRVVRFTWRDTDHPAYVVSVVRQALGSLALTPHELAKRAV